jgi:hypothetical protein
MKGTELVRTLHRWTERHGGVITRQQALNLGADDRLIAHLVGTGAWRRMHPGVFVLAGTPHSHTTAVRAALAALGPGAVASHESAAWLAGLLDRPPTVVQITVFDDRRRRLPGVRVRRSRHPDRGQSWRGLPCTSSVRILIDLAGVESPGAVAAALDRALAAGQVRIGDLERATRAGVQLAGAPALRRCLRDLGHIGAPQPSVLESRMARLFIRYRLPVPRAELVWGDQRQYRLDFAYPAIRLAIEVYGYAWHHSPQQLDRDLARQRHLQREGWTVLAFTWRQILEDSEGVAAEVEATYRRLSAAA